METKRLKLSAYAAVAVQGAINERQQLAQVLQQKDGEIKRLTDLQMGEADINVAEFRCVGVELIDCETYLALEAIPQPESK